MICEFPTYSDSLNLDVAPDWGKARSGQLKHDR